MIAGLKGKTLRRASGATLKLHEKQLSNQAIDENFYWLHVHCEH